MKTAKEIQGDFYTIISKSSLAKAVNGGVYRQGFRPYNSQLEDIVIIFTAGQNGRYQSGVITVHIYVPDIVLSDGVYYENGARTLVLERAAQKWYESFQSTSDDYHLRLYNTITTEADETNNQHFVVLQFTYKLFID